MRQKRELRPMCTVLRGLDRKGQSPGRSQLRHSPKQGQREEKRATNGSKKKCNKGKRAVCSKPMQRAREERQGKTSDRFSFEIRAD